LEQTATQRSDSLAVDRPKAERIMKEDSISADAGSLVFHECGHILILLILGHSNLSEGLGHAN
jgi:hypothetical protein